MSRRGGERSPAEREAARRERERRRYEKAGKPIPDHLLDDPPADAAAEELAAPSFFDEPPAEPAPAESPREEPAFFEEPPRGEEPAFFDEPPREEPAFSEEPPRERPHRETEPPAAPASPPQHGATGPLGHEPPAADVAAPREAEPAAHDAPAEPEHDPQATQQWDVTESWLDDAEPHRSQEAARQAPPPPPPPAPAREAAPRAPEPEPPVPEQDPHATRAYDAHDPQATQAHDALAPHAADAHDPHATHAHDVTTDWTDEHAALDPPSEEHEAPLGTRRVTGRQRIDLSHIHRPRRGDDATPRRGRGRGVRVKRPGEVAGGGTLTRRRSSWAGRIAALVVVLIAGALVWFLVSLFQPFGGEGSGNVTVRVPQGATAGEIGDLLAERGVVPSSFFFGLRAQLSGDRSNLKSGTFRLRRDMSYAAAIEALTRVAPPPPTITVAIPEGRSRRETVSIARRGGLRGDYLTASRRSSQLNPRRYGAPAGATLEGFLFPATYELPRGARVRRLVDDQLRAFRENLAQVDLRYARSRNLTVFDVLTIASMVEREVSVASERPLVAAVIYNRLRDGIPLGIDATLRFEQNDWVNPLRQSVLDADTPYNTRTRQGLPPGPIGSPGLASIRAAANPARSNALYYVVKPGTCGEHAFSETFEQFQLDVQRYDQAREAAGGRSPTRC
ncbi:endolytic transglycosylase MltG [Conexibacter arvalis]|uniref:Endolytic murein transglycosylase n=1 Tax=Conexibacter arvalis TaxID=912552 RepID=A0A840IJF9_9ACTN|nr:endolytic transglycosylase MltG [Conexibacter arvalis]MBB4664869.1 putative YceG family protein [Conexibacter arvalis]